MVVRDQRSGPAHNRLASTQLQPRRGRLDRRLIGIGALYFDFAGIDTIAARGIDRIELFAAERQVGDAAVGRWDDAVHSAGLIADLDAHPRGDIEPPIAIDADAVGAGV